MEIYKFVCSSKNLYHATQKRCKTEKNLLYIIMRLNTHGPPPLVPGSILTPSDQCRDHPIWSSFVVGHVRYIWTVLIWITLEIFYIYEVWNMSLR